MNQLISLSSKIYDVSIYKPKEVRRAIAFILRSLPYYSTMNRLIDFFHANPLRQQIFETRPYIIAQATRPFFYFQATYTQRIYLVMDHFAILDNLFITKGLSELYLNQGMILWCDSYQDQTISIRISFKEADMKEGLLTLSLHIGEERIYRSIFWLARNASDEPFLWIGALQGPRDGHEIVRSLTKHFFGYRPKNLIIFAIRALVQNLSLKGIYAVSNHGHYDNNYSSSLIAGHKFKLKTSLDDFWEQTGGTKCDNPCFYELPIEEPRKTIEEVVSHKRNLYRKRFTLLDEITASISKQLALYLKK
jgi:uncharacterized protein VirK/YbjX